MASSESSSSAGRRSSGSRLLQELEALSQSLYKSQHVLPPRRTGSLALPNAKDSRSGLFSDVDEAIPLPGLANAGGHAFNVPGSMRHSIALPQAESFDGSARESLRSGPKARFSASAAVGGQSMMMGSDQSMDIRERKKRYSSSPRRSRGRSEDNCSVEDENDLSSWIEENIDFSRRLAASAEKRKGFWNWKPIRALSHIGMQRFNCLFSVHVASIEGLPASMNGLRLAVHLRKKGSRDGAVQTMPARVFQCMAEFDETLHIKCHIYGSNHSSSHGLRFQSRPFTLSVVAVDVDELDFLKHHLDLSVLLQETMQKQALGEEFSNGWNISFELLGKARGAELGVGLGYEILDKDALDKIGSVSFRFKDSFSRRNGRNSTQSLPNSARGTPSPHQPSATTNFMRMDHLDLNEPSIDLDRRGVTLQNVYPTRLPYRGVDNSVTNAFALIDRNPRHSSSLEEENLAGFRRTARNPQESIPEPSAAAGSSDDKANLRWTEDHGGAEDDVSFDVVMQGIEIEEPSDKNKNDDSAGAVQKSEAEGDRIPVEDGGEIVKEVVQEEQQRRLTELDSIAQQISDLEYSIMHGKTNAEPLDLESPDLENLDMKAHDGNEANQKAANLLEPARDDVSIKGDETVISILDAEADLVTGEFLHMLEAQEGVNNRLNGILSDVPALHLDQLTNENNTNASLPISLSKDTEDSSSNVGSRRLGSERSVWEDTDEDAEQVASILEAAESELERATRSLNSKTRAKLLEDAETEALMQKWGLNEKVFESSHPKISIPTGPNNSNRVPMKYPAPPDLGDGLGPVVQTKDGGMIASMDPAHFQSGGRLVVQVSKPVVVPDEMGSSAVEILQKMAAMGADDLTVQAMASMPLDDITGKTVEQIAFEGMATAINKHGYTRTCSASQNELKDQGKGSMISKGLGAAMAGSRRSDGGFSRIQTTHNITDECVPIESLAPLAMPKIEAMAMEGLKIQAEMAEEEAPYSVSPAPRSSCSNTVAEGMGNSQQLALPDDAKSKGLMAIGISVEEWMRLDAGLYDEEKTSQRTRAIMSAHGARHRDLITSDNQNINSGEKNHKEQEHDGGKEHGNMGNYLTIGLLVQLRDPFRNHEPVGSPMIAFVQAERVAPPCRPTISKSVSMNEVPDEDADNNQTPRFRIKGVHVSGLKMLQDEKRGTVWDGDKQRQTVSRWLIANRMSKNFKHPLLKSMAHTKAKQGDQSSLWSISAQVNGGGEKNRNDINSRLKPRHIRNPNVIFAH